MMRNPSCAHETDVLDLVWTGQWPARADIALKEHVDACEVCRDLVAVATAIGELDEGTAGVKVPDAGAIWYSAQIRAREELTRRATRPVLLAELTALACGIASVFFAWRLVGGSVAGWIAALEWPATPPMPNVPQWADVLSFAGSSTFPWMAGAAVAWALVIPTALYIARLADRTPDHRDHRP